MGRKSTFSQQKLDEICERLSLGEPLAQICRSEGMPDRSTVHRWADGNEEISQRIARAREDGEEVIAADCLNIADDNGNDRRYLPDGREVTDADVVQRARLRIETRLKLLAKWNPKKWGEKIDHTTGGEKLPAPQIIMPK